MKLKEFTITSARPLPVILMLDTSGSMQVGGKIDVLNKAVREMLSDFAEEDSASAEIHVAAVTFGKTAQWHLDLTPADQVLDQWKDLKAAGKTPLGGAIKLLQDALEDKETIPSRAYRPTIILVSDGIPTDDWGEAIREFLKSDRSMKASRFSMGIGEDVDTSENSVLQQFIGDKEGARVFSAHEASQMQKFFRFVTMTVTTRTRSTNPNTIVASDPDDFDDDDYFNS
jgi:uncharacterized protein YegL